jgi:hypothetical protein
MSIISFFFVVSLFTTVLQQPLNPLKFVGQCLVKVNNKYIDVMIALVFQKNPIRKQEDQSLGFLALEDRSSPVEDRSSILT